MMPDANILFDLYRSLRWYGVWIKLFCNDGCNYHFKLTKKFPNFFRLRGKLPFLSLFAQVLEQCNGHLHQLQPLMRKIQEHENKLKDIRREDEVGNSEDDRVNSQAGKTIIQGAMKSDQFGALVHHLSLVRNKCCLMAYVYNRAEAIRNLGWMVDGDLPEEIKKKLSNSEEEYFKKHFDTLRTYREELDISLCLDMVPPRDPYIKVEFLMILVKLCLAIR